MFEICNEIFNKSENAVSSEILQVAGKFFPIGDWVLRGWAGCLEDGLGKVCCARRTEPLLSPS